MGKTRILQNRSLGRTCHSCIACTLQVHARHQSALWRIRSTECHHMTADQYQGRTCSTSSHQQYPAHDQVRTQYKRRPRVTKRAPLCGIYQPRKPHTTKRSERPGTPPPRNLHIRDSTSSSAQQSGTDPPHTSADRDKRDHSCQSAARTCTAPLGTPQDASHNCDPTTSSVRRFPIHRPHTP